MRVLGRFGDTHTTPGRLFDAGDRAASPPAGVVDVQFRVPVSLSLLLEAMAATGQQAGVDAWAAGYRDLLCGQMLRKVQHAGGYALLASSGVAVPARLEVAATVDRVVPGVGTRWHGHVWVGPTAVTIADGDRQPVAVEILRQRMQSQVWAFYLRELEALSVDLLQVRWDEARPGAVREVVEPPWHEHVGSAERGVCPGPWGRTGQVVLADELDLRVSAQMEESHRVAVAQGTVYDPDAIDPLEASDALMRGLMTRQAGAAAAQER